MPEPVDPAKLKVIEGTFRAQGQVLSQISLNQVGPVSMGFVLCSLDDAELYLRASKPVSTEPLGLLVFHRPDVPCETLLPHCEVVVPCRCTMDNEPVLADATLVQLGTGMVEKFAGNSLVQIESPEVATVKFLVYKDEYPEDWKDFCQSQPRTSPGYSQSCAEGS